MDRVAYVRHSRINLLAFAFSAVAGMLVAFAIGIDAQLFIGIMVGSSMTCILFQNWNTKNFMLLADMVDLIEEMKERNREREQVSRTIEAP